MSTKVCRSCGGKEFCEDFNSEVVCEQCGLVVSNEQTFDYSAEQSVTSSAISVNKSRLPWYLTGGSSINKRQTVTAQMSLSKIDHLASALNFDSCSKAQAKDMFKSAYEIEPFKFYKTKHKYCLAACCTFIAARRWSKSPRFVSLETVSNLIQVPRNEVFLVYKELQRLKLFELESSGIDVENKTLLNGYIKDFKLEESKKMTETALKLIDVCEKISVSTGVNPKPFFAAAIYVAWTVDTSPIRNVSLKAFCRRCEVVYESTMRRFNEIVTVLIEISKGIPFYKEGMVNKKNVFHHLDTILKYPNALIADRKKQVDDPSVFDVVQNMRVKRKSSQLDPNASVESNPVITHDLDSEELTEKDIPDDQMDDYLRSEDEVNYIKLLKKKFRGNENESRKDC